VKPDPIHDPVSSPEPALLRFDRTERAVHWATAAIFVFLMLSGAALYAGPVSTIVGRRDLVRTLHVLAGFALPVPILAGLIGRRWGTALRRDLGRLNRFDAEDRRWFHRRARRHVRLGKFNPGQKLNATFLAAAGVVMLGTGIVLHWFHLFDDDIRTGATFVHDWFALGIWLSVTGHVVLAARDPIALGGMLRGSVTARWARTGRPRWYEEVTGRPAERLKAPARSGPNPADGTETGR
jgi:formate dehydrogenase subunit gamma